MSTEDIAALIRQYQEGFHEKVTGNEANPIIAARIEGLVHTDRAALLDVLREWIGTRIPETERQPGDGVRESRLWLALEIARRYRLVELRPDIEALMADIRAGRSYLPYYVDMIATRLQGLK